MAAGWRAPAWIGAGWIVLGVVAGVLEGLAVGGVEAFRLRPGLPLAGLLWVPLTFAAARLSRAVAWDPDRRLRFVLVHGAAAVAAGFVLNAGHFGMGVLAGWEDPGAFVPGVMGASVRWLHLNAGAWLLMVGAFHAVDGRLPVGGPRPDRASAPPDGVAHPRPPTLHVARGQGGLQVPLADIGWLEADGDYVRVHATDRVHLVSRRMKALERELGGRDFVRVHRSAIVNVAHVREVRHRSHGDFEAVLADGTRVRVSRTRRAALLEALGP